MGEGEMLFSLESISGAWTGMTTNLSTRLAKGLSGERGGMSSKLDMRRRTLTGCLLPTGVVGTLWLRFKAASDCERTSTGCGFDGGDDDGKGGGGDVGVEGGGDGGGE